MNKHFFRWFLLLLLLSTVVYFLNFYVEFYNSELLHPLFWFMVPLVPLFLISSFLKKADSKILIAPFFIFILVSLVLLASISSSCSQILCIDRSSLALILSSIFSVVIFVFLLIKNK